MEKAEIIINNQKSRLLCDARILLQVRKLMAIKAKNYFWSPAYRQRKWDGYINYITESGGLFETGLLDQVCNHLRTLEVKFKIIDRRERFKELHEITELGDLTLRDDQVIALNSIFNNKVEGIKFTRGIMAEATNYGKSIISAGVFASCSQKRNGLLLVNSKTLFEQALPDIAKLLGKGQVGWVKSGSVKWGRVNVCMVQTLGNLIKKDPRIRNSLSKQDIVLIDEYDELIGRKDCKLILQNCFNAFIRIGFTGSELVSKDKNRNQDQLKFCGPIIHKTTNKELVEMGISTKPNINFFLGNDRVKIRGNWQKEYEKGVIKNKRRNNKIWRLANRRVENGPVLILFKIHKHGYEIRSKLPFEMEENYRVKLIHHKTPNREFILKDFRDGKVDILISSMIIKRGINLPKIRTLINAAGGDSEANILQIFGRALRKDESKDVVDIIEFFDLGYYLQRHSKHRIRYYKSQKFPVNELYKKKLLAIKR